MAYERILSLPQVEYKSPADFTAEYSSSTILTLSSLPITVENSAQVAYIRVVSGSQARTYINGQYGVAFSYTSSIDTVTVYNAGSNVFTTDDEYEVGLSGQKPGYSLALDLYKTQDQSPATSWYTDGEQLVTSAQTLTDAWADLGSEIDMRGYNNLNIYITVDINDSIDVRLKTLGKYESAGTDEFDFSIETTDSGSVKINPKYYEFNSDIDQLQIMKIPTNGIPYIQLQIMAVATGSSIGSISDCYINKIWD